jgi:acyl carrier protein
MREDDVYPKLTGIFRELFLRGDLVLTPGLTAADVEGWDSFRQVEILLAVEQEFGVKFHTREIDSMHNVGELARMVATKTERLGSAQAGNALGSSPSQVEASISSLPAMR